MTIDQCMAKTMKLINLYSVSGTAVPPTDPVRMDFAMRAAALIDAAQQELACAVPIVRVAEFSQRRLPNLLSGAPLLLSDAPFEAVCAGARALCLRACGAAEISASLEDGAGFAELFREALPDTGCFAAFTRRLENPEGRRVRIRIGGEGAAVEGLAAFSRDFASDAEIPLFGPFRFHALPERFRAVESLSLRPFLRASGAPARSWALEHGRLGLPWDFSGSALLAYRAYPAPVDEKTPGTQELEATPEAAEAVPYYAAAHLIAEENPALSETLMGLYRGKLRGVQGTESGRTAAVANRLYAFRDRGLPR